MVLVTTASSISAETMATTATATDAAVTRRVPHAATVATAAGEATARPLLPRGRSRADQAVTARRSRSISSWSGTSIARAGTTRAANMEPTSSNDQATAGRGRAARDADRP